MKLPSSFRRFLRKVARYAGPVGATTALRGCPCPPAVHVPDKPYAASIQVDATTTFDSTPESWAPWCTANCGNSSSPCFVRVSTREGNSMPIAVACNEYSTKQDMSSSQTPWLKACKDACGEAQDCLIGPDPLQENKPIIRCESWWTNCSGGRGTDGIDSPAALGEDRAALALAKMAALEAESVPAFQRLARELAVLGAPRGLRRRASRSRQDEKRHARTMASLARRRGATISMTNHTAPPLPLRSLEEVALENAVEGCVRETYGAWLAWQQARNARDPELRGAMRRIAMDEARHAALAWDIHRWAMQRVGRDARDRIDEGMKTAWIKIAESMADRRDPAAIELGLVTFP
jgi:hypothetical protein